MLYYNRDRSLHPGSRYIGRIPGVRLAHAEQGTVTDLAHRAIHNDASQTEYKAGGLLNTLQSQLLNATPLFQRLGSVLLFLQFFRLFLLQNGGNFNE